MDPDQYLDVPVLLQLPQRLDEAVRYLLGHVTGPFLQGLRSNVLLSTEAPRLLFQGVVAPVHEGVAPSGVLDIVRGREETIPELGGRDNPPRNSTPQYISFQGKSVIGVF